MWDMNEVVAIEYVKDWIYHVRFDDGLEGMVDLSGYLNRGPVFRRFADLEYFKQAFIEGGTIAWPGGVDLAPERLYEMTADSSQAVRKRA